MKKRLLMGWAILLWAGCSRPAARPPAASASPVSVRVTTVQARSLGTQTSFPGTIKSRRQAVLATKLPGRITYLQAEEGDIVSAGSVVAQIDVSDLEARTAQATAGRDSALAALQQSQAGLQQSWQSVAQAEAQWKTLLDQQGEARARLELARKDEQRYRSLAKEGAIPSQRADQALTELRVAQSRVLALQGQIAGARVGIRQSKAGVTQAQSSIARSQAGISEAEAGIRAAASDLDYGTVRAPFRGVVVEKSAYQGELNTPGRPLLKIQDLDRLEVSLTLPETRLEQISTGKILQAQIPSLDRKLDLKVRQLIASTDPATRSFEVRLTPLQPPPRLLPGTFVKVLLAQPARSLLVLPRQALVQRGQLEGSFVVSGGLAEFRLLQLGATFPEGREILSGLQAEEQVILDAPESLQDGQKVSIQ